MSDQNIATMNDWASAQRRWAQEAGSRAADYPDPPALTGKKELIWDEDDHPVRNYARLGRQLAAAGDLYRRPDYASSLLLVPAGPDAAPAVIDKGARLAAVVADRVRVRVVKAGNTRGGQIPAGHLTTMLACEAFLQQFPPLDGVVKAPHYLSDFTLISPGYHDGGPGQRLLYVGPVADVADSTDAIEAFLNVMPFATDADRTNAVGGALTVLLRNHWPGAKPAVVATATKSHAGKDTLVAFAAGSAPKLSVSYEATDWALQKAVVAALKQYPETGVLNVENARLGRGDRQIASAFLERLLTDPEPVLFSTGTGIPARVKNHVVVTVTTNHGTVSEDLMNRALPIHLNPVGDVADRRPAIGNPKLEYLPKNRARIEAELRGMVERWKAAGRPLDERVCHPFTDWARTVGGILLANGFTDFLGNYRARKSADDPVRRGLGLLGTARPDVWLRPDDWARLAVTLGLVKAVIPDGECDTDKSRERGVGVVLSAHRDETFVAETDDAVVSLVLEKKRARFGAGEATTRYRFATLRATPMPEDEVVNAAAQEV
jgi:hypothetical protein